MRDSYYIGAYWGPRPQSLDEVTNSIVTTLKGLAEIDAQFLHWYERGMSHKQALEKEVLPIYDNIKKLCLKSLKRGELDEKGFGKLGFGTGLWTGHKDEESSDLSFNVGINSAGLNNCCVLKIPYEGDATCRLLQKEKAMPIIKLFVNVWDADSVVLTSHQLEDRLNTSNKIGWITYRKFINNIPNKDKNIIFEKYKNGTLFYFNNEHNYNIDKLK